MKLVFLGVGGAFNPESGCSSAIVQVQGKTFLVDCGYDVFPKIKYLADKITAVCITHCHDDHIGSLSSFLLYRAKVLNLAPTQVICSPQVWSNLVRIISLTTGPNFADFVSHIPGNEQVKIINTSGLHVPYLESCAFLFVDNGKYFLYSGDVNSPCLSLINLNPSRCLIFHDVWHEPSANHCWYHLLQDYRDFRIVGYHYVPEAASLFPKDFELAKPHTEYSL